MAANRGRQVARLRRGIVVLGLLAIAGLSQTRGAVATRGTTATSTVKCTWQVAGTWHTQTPPYSPTFELTQNGMKIGGTETFSAADAAAAGFPNPTATVAGTLDGDQLDIVATFHGVLKAGRRAAGTLRAEYKGTVTQGSVTGGSAQDITTPHAGAGAWTAAGPAECVNRYLWTASGKTVYPNGPRVLLPELPNGGVASYRVAVLDASTFGLFSTDDTGKVVSAQGKVTVSEIYRRVLTANNNPADPLAKAPLSVSRTVTFTVSSGTTFSPWYASANHGGSVALMATLELDTLSGCAAGQPVKVYLSQTEPKAVRFRVYASECLAGGTIQSGAAAGEQLADFQYQSSTLHVVISKRP